MAASPHKKQQPGERKKLTAGHTILSESNEYTIVEVLGSGGFGDVYKVVRTCDSGGAQYAMKTELNDKLRRKMLDRLKVEMGVFMEIMDIKDTERRQHFLEMIDKGRTEEFKFIVMGIVSFSIETIRKDFTKAAQLKMHSVIKVGLQTLEAIASLHSVGYIHRDIKPHNFCIGLPPKDNNIYMLDFGIARRYMEKDGKIRIPREKVKFLGTVKYASRNCHRLKEQSRKDDLETWCYMIMDLMHLDNLIWRGESDRQRVLMLKDKVFDNPKVLAKSPPDFRRIMKFVDGLQYHDLPDYIFIQRALEDMAKREKVTIAHPFEWAGKNLKKMKEEGEKRSEKHDDDLEDDDDDEEDSSEAQKMDRSSKGKKDLSSRRRGNKPKKQDEPRKARKKSSVLKNGGGTPKGADNSALRTSTRRKAKKPVEEGSQTSEKRRAKRKSKTEPKSNPKETGES